MRPRKPFLSKSRLISAWQCPKRLYLEKHHPELGEISSQTEALFATGHAVGAVAQAQYGTADSVEIAFDFKTMVAETRRLIEQGADFPIFEATFRHENVLVRADVLIPEEGGWRVVEVKASTSVKDYHKLDCAIQLWVMRESGVPVTSISLAHINNRFVYPGHGDYDGLFIEHDLTGEAETLRQAVVDLVVEAREAVSGPMPAVAVGTRCTNPYDCQFINYCWPTDSEYPIAGLKGGKAKLGDYVALGCRDIRDVDPSSITAATQQRIYRVTCAGEPEILPGAGEALRALEYPRYYLDFETIGPAVPIWPGTRPYAAIPVQWSCHIEDEPGDLRHEEFLDLSGHPPMRALAERMIECLGDAGPVLMYTSYEKQVIERLIELLPDLEPPLQSIIDRLFDLHPVVRDNYYHPDMLGSWSIKAVLPTIAPDMDYSQLDGIKEGTAASEGFLEAINPQTTPERKSELEEQLLRYCKFDTEAMVEIVRFFSMRTS
jgi:predicted RecB family nuclease